MRALADNVGVRLQSVARRQSKVGVGNSRAAQLVEVLASSGCRSAESGSSRKLFDRLVLKAAWRWSGLRRRSTTSGGQSVDFADLFVENRCGDQATQGADPRASAHGVAQFGLGIGSRRHDCLQWRRNQSCQVASALLVSRSGRAQAAWQSMRAASSSCVRVGMVLLGGRRVRS